MPSFIVFQRGDYVETIEHDNGPRLEVASRT